MLAVLVTVLCAAPTQREVAVLLTSERRVAPDITREVLAQVSEGLAGEKLEVLTGFTLAERLASAGGVEAARKCQGAAACVARLAKAADAVVVSVDVGKLGRTLTVQLDAVAPDGTVLATSSVSVVWKPGAVAGPLATFASSLAPRMPAPKAAAARPADDAPTPLPQLQPSPPLLPPAAVAPRRSASKVPWVLGGVAVASAVVAAVFGIMALSARASWDRNLVDGGTGTLLTPSEAAALSRTINTDATVALGGGAGAAAFAVAALVTAFAF